MILPFGLIYELVTTCYFIFSYLQVNGAVVNIRARADKLAVWLADASQSEAIVAIGKMLKERLGLDTVTTMGFNVHQEEKSMTRPASSYKQRFTL